MPQHKKKKTEREILDLIAMTSGQGHDKQSYETQNSKKIWLEQLEVSQSPDAHLL